MPADSPNLLTDLVASAVRQTEKSRAERSEDDLHRLVETWAPPLDLFAALRGPGLSVIAEMKPRSPSAGQLIENYRPADLARGYERGGAAALSVLTHEDAFGGSPEHLAEARSATGLPILRKDFVVDEYQVLEGRALGADTALLIVAALTTERLDELIRYCRSLGMEPLVEVHDEAEARTALSVDARIIGVNHRNLRDLTIDPTLTAVLAPLIGRDRVIVSESGVKDGKDAAARHAAGADAILVGETLLRSGSPEAEIGKLVRT